MNKTTPLTYSSDGDDLLAIVQTFRGAMTEGLVARERTATGVRFQMRPAAAAAVREFVRREQACCPFFTFDFVEKGPDLVLGIAGPEAASPLLDLLFQLAKPSVSPAS